MRSVQESARADVSTLEVLRVLSGDRPWLVEHALKAGRDAKGISRLAGGTQWLIEYLSEKYPEELEGNIMRTIRLLAP